MSDKLLTGIEKLSLILTEAHAEAIENRMHWAEVEFSMIDTHDQYYVCVFIEHDTVTEVSLNRSIIPLSQFVLIADKL